jgi:hypothetical protein
MPSLSINLFCVLTLAASGAAAPAWAYLDPGTGSMILQVLLGGFAGLALVGRLYWRRFLVLIGLRSETVAPTEPQKPRADR